MSTKTKIFGDDEKKSDNFGKGRKWYFVTKFVLTYCEKKLFLVEIDVLMKYRFWVYERFFLNLFPKLNIIRTLPLHNSTL